MTPPENKVPDPPSKVNATEIGITSISLQWDIPEGNGATVFAFDVEQVNHSKMFFIFPLARVETRLDSDRLGTTN